jgi:predicted transcriptional regulator
MSNSSEYVLADGARGTAWTEDGTDHRSDGDWDTASGPGGRRGRPAGRDGEPDTASVGEPTLTEVLRVVVDIGIGEREAYVALAEQDATSAGDLAEQLDRDRSNVNRYLNSLYQKNLVTRRRRILQSGGHVYEYSARSPDSVRELLLAGLHEWAEAASAHLDQLVAETAEAAERVTPREESG